MFFSPSVKIGQMFVAESIASVAAQSLPSQTCELDSGCGWGRDLGRSRVKPRQWSLARTRPRKYWTSPVNLHRLNVKILLTKHLPTKFLFHVLKFVARAPPQMLERYAVIGILRVFASISGRSGRRMKPLRGSAWALRPTLA